MGWAAGLTSDLIFHAEIRRKQRQYRVFVADHPYDIGLIRLAKSEDPDPDFEEFRWVYHPIPGPPDERPSDSHVIRAFGEHIRNPQKHRYTMRAPEKPPR